MAISKSLQEVLDRGGSLSDDQARELAQHNFETGSGRTQFNHGTFGSLDFANVNTPGSIEFNLFNTQRQQETQNNLQQAQDIFRQQTGQELRGVGLETVTGHLQQGESADQALKQLGDLRNFVRFGGGERRGSTSGVDPTESVFERMQRTGETLTDVQASRGAQQTAADFANQLPKPQKIITPERLEQEDIVSMPGGNTTGNETAETAVAGTTAFQEQLDQFTTELQPGERKAQTILDKLADLTGEGTKRGKDQLVAEEEAGVAEKRAELQKIKGKMISKQKEFEAYKLAQEGKPITMQSISGNIAQKRNLIASELLLLQADALIAQGELADVQATVDRAIDLKYQSLDNEYRIYEAQLRAIQPLLDKEEKARAEARQQLVNQQRQALADQKNKEKQIQSLQLQAISQGVTDRGVIQQIGEAPDVVEAATRLQESLPQAPVDGPDPGPPEEPLSINQIEQFRRSYGWTPPFGFNESQLLQYMEDNPNATPEELEAGAKGVTNEAPTEEVPEEAVGQAGNFIDVNYFKENFTDDQLKDLSDRMGTSRFYTPKSSDIKRFLGEVMSKVEKAREAGFSDEDIILKLQGK